MPPINNIEVQVVSPLPVTEVQVQRTGPQGPAGADGPAGPNSVTSATTSDGTADLSVATITVGNAAAFNGATFTYGTGAASAHRTALGLGTGDSPTFAGVRATGNGSVSAPVIRFGTIGDHGFYTVGGSTVNLSIGLIQRYIFGTSAGNFGFRIMSDTGIRIGETNDVSLSRLAAGQWGMGSGALGTFDASLKLTGIENLGTLSVTGASTLSGGATFGGTTEQAATRTALGGGATGQAIFQAATTSAAQTAAGFVTLTPAAYADLVATGTADADTIYIVQE
jgi:hypothetical protein